MGLIDYALLNYEGGSGNGSPSTIGVFLSDYNTFSCVKRWLNKYKRGQQINVRLLINQMVLLFNMFTFESVEFILKSNCKEHHTMINTLFAFFLSRESYGDGIDDEFMVMLKGILK